MGDWVLHEDDGLDNLDRGGAAMRVGFEGPVGVVVRWLATTGFAWTDVLVP